MSIEDALNSMKYEHKVIRVISSFVTVAHSVTLSFLMFLNRT